MDGAGAAAACVVAAGVAADVPNPKAEMKKVTMYLYAKALWFYANFGK